MFKFVLLTNNPVHGLLSGLTGHGIPVCLHLKACAPLLTFMKVDTSFLSQRFIRMQQIITSSSLRKVIILIRTLQILSAVENCLSFTSGYSVRDPFSYGIHTETMSSKGNLLQAVVFELTLEQLWSKNTLAVFHLIAYVHQCHRKTDRLSHGLQSRQCF